MRDIQYIHLTRQGPKSLPASPARVLTWHGQLIHGLALLHFAERWAAWCRGDRPVRSLARVRWTPRRPAAGAGHRWRVRSAAAKVLHEREPGDDHLRGAVGTQTAHRSQPLSKATVIGFDPVVCVLFDVVPGRRDQFLEAPRPFRTWHGYFATTDVDSCCMRRTSSQPSPTASAHT